MNTLPIFAHFRQTAIAALAVLLGVFVFYTSFNGPFESLVQRAIFVMMITALAVLMHPLFEGSRLRPCATGSRRTAQMPPASSRPH